MENPRSILKIPLYLYHNIFIIYRLGRSSIDYRRFLSLSLSLRLYKRTGKGERAIINGICHDSINDRGRLEFVYKAKGWRKIGDYLITGRYLAQNVGN